MKKAFKLSSLLMLTLTLASCDWFESDDDVNATAGSGSTTVNSSASNQGTTTSGTTKEAAAWYNGRTNGNRPTWYYAKKMSSYPKTFTLNVSGCRTGIVVSNNGSRWESGGYLVKQSDVSGRGMAVLAPSGCNPSGSYITY
jgi:hypothetical protein